MVRCAKAALQRRVCKRRLRLDLRAGTGAPLAVLAVMQHQPDTLLALMQLTLRADSELSTVLSPVDLVPLKVVDSQCGGPTVNHPPPRIYMSFLDSELTCNLFKLTKCSRRGEYQF